MSSVRILMLGDVAAKAGLQALKRMLHKLIADEGVDFVVANGENVAGGIGITPDLANEIFKNEVDVITSGNHIWRQHEIRSYIEHEPRLLRPLNFLKGQPGAGFGVYETAAGVPIGVINLAGQVYMDPADNPFVAADTAFGKLKDQAKIILVDFHAEVTSEKRAMGFHMDGRATCVIGTHTHVQTADETVLEGGTAYCTDIGMTGPHDSVIGMRKELILERFRTGLPRNFKPSNSGVRLQGVVVDADSSSGRATGIKRLDLALP